LTREVGVDRGREIPETVTGLPMAGFDDRQDRLCKATSAGALRTERQFASDHRRPQGALAGVVGRFDTVHF
jgi:hypothetical protein